MNDLGFHLVLFLLVVLAIVIASAVYAEPDDAKALKSLPRRLTYMVVGCGILTAVMLVCESLFT